MIWKGGDELKKTLKYGESINVFIKTVNDGQESDFDHLWNVKFYHNESKDFRRVMI